ncbi:hypothetical protein BLSTO_03594 [Blastocystis sp. subtype 1]
MSFSNVQLANVQSLQRNWDALDTKTTRDQQNNEEKCAFYLIPNDVLDPQQRIKRYELGYWDEKGQVRFMREAHIQYLKKHLGELGTRYMSQASSKPWLYYHVLNSLDLLDAEDTSLYEGATASVEACYTDGGYAGGEFEFPHLMTTYAAVNTLVLMQKYSMIHRDALYALFMSLKSEEGSFQVHLNGESDTRGCYCVLSMCRLLNLLREELTSGVCECQSYEGGFGSNPGSEAHGGYTYCAVACLSILNRLGDCDVDGLEKWLVDRQYAFEGGYNGRTNKLVDGCYSWYIGASLELVRKYRNARGYPNRASMLKYAYCMEQNMSEGGLRDKPEMHSDLYHTMYCLCGLSVLGALDVIVSGEC